MKSIIISILVIITYFFIHCLQNTNTEFCQLKASNQSGAQREAILKDLAAGFDMFMELKSNLEEGTKVFSKGVRELCPFINWFFSPICLSYLFVEWWNIVDLINLINCHPVTSLSFVNLLFFLQNFKTKKIYF